MNAANETFLIVSREAKQDPEFSRYFELMDLVGQGGMGVLVRARQLALTRDVAVKFIMVTDELQDETVRQRFRAEVRTMSKLQGPHFVKVIHAGNLQTGTEYLVMELLQGLDLEELQRRKNRLPSRTVMGLAVQAATALLEAHRSGVVHRDVKPANLFLQDNGILKVLDFGVSRIIEARTGKLRLTNTGALLGSPFYVSPEQLKDPRHVNEATDVWSLGVTLYQLTTGRVPFDGNTVLEVADAVRYQSPVNPRQLVGDTPREFAQLICSCLDKDPDRRIDMAALHSELSVMAREWNAFPTELSWQDAGPHSGLDMNPAPTTTAGAELIGRVATSKGLQNTLPSPSSAAATGFFGRRRAIFAAIGAAGVLALGVAVGSGFRGNGADGSGASLGVVVGETLVPAQVNAPSAAGLAPGATAPELASQATSRWMLQPSAKMAEAAPETTASQEVRTLPSIPGAPSGGNAAHLGLSGGGEHLGAFARGGSVGER